MPTVVLRVPLASCPALMPHPPGKLWHGLYATMLLLLAAIVHDLRRHLEGCLHRTTFAVSLQFRSAQSRLPPSEQAELLHARGVNTAHGPGSAIRAALESGTGP